MGTFNASAMNTLRENSLFRLENSLKDIQLLTENESSGDAYRSAGVHYRALAICELMIDANTDRFFGFLRKGAYLRLYFLSKIENDNHPKAFNLTSKVHFLFFICAVIAEDFNTLIALAKFAPSKHNPDYEYEDDFLHHLFLYRLALSIFASEPFDSESIIKRWEFVLEGGTDYSLDICKSMIEHDPNKFDTALTNLIIERKEKIEDWKKDYSMHPDIRVMESHIFFRGLALTKLAEQSGMAIDNEYELMPSLSRISPNIATLPLDSWKAPELGMPSS